MKKIFSIIGILVICLLVGCESASSGGMKLRYEPLSEREMRILSLTGDKIIMYNIENLPERKGFEVEISYEIYEGDVKIKEEPISGIATLGPTEKEVNLNFGINIQDNQIRSNINMDGAMGSNDKDIPFNLNEISYGFLSEDKEVKLGDEVYIFHGIKGSTFSPIDLGVNIEEERFKEVLNRHEENFLIKLSIKEVTQ